MGNSLQEIALRDAYCEPIENWLKNRLIDVPSSKKIYKQIISFLSNKLSIPNLTDISNILNLTDYAYLDLQKDCGINQITEMLYEIPPEILLTYYSLCSEILDLFKEHLIQRHPTIRVHFQDEKCFQFYPFWHSDPILGHPPYEKNIWIPLTQPHKETFHGFSVSNPSISSKIFKNFCFSSPYETKNNQEVIKNKEFYNFSDPVKCKPGQAIVFDSRLFHSALPHVHPRISLDIRIIEKKYLSDPYPVFKGLGRKKMAFDDENFFINIDEINSKKLSIMENIKSMN